MVGTGDNNFTRSQCPIPEGENSLALITLNATQAQIIPGFYHLFYVDCHMKPTVALYVRFDDNVQDVTGTAAAPN
jgi:hypothetical protein